MLPRYITKRAVAETSSEDDIRPEDVGVLATFTYSNRNYVWQSLDSDHMLIFKDMIALEYMLTGYLTDRDICYQFVDGKDASKVTMDRVWKSLPTNVKKEIFNPLINSYDKAVLEKNENEKLTIQSTYDEEVIKTITEYLDKMTYTVYGDLTLEGFCSEQAIVIIQELLTYTDKKEDELIVPISSVLKTDTNRMSWVRYWCHREEITNKSGKTEIYLSWKDCPQWKFFYDNEYSIINAYQIMLNAYATNIDNNLTKIELTELDRIRIDKKVSDAFRLEMPTDIYAFAFDKTKVDKKTARPRPIPVITIKAMTAIQDNELDDITFMWDYSTDNGETWQKVPNQTDEKPYLSGYFESDGYTPKFKEIHTYLGKSKVTLLDTEEYKQTAFCVIPVPTVDMDNHKYRLTIEGKTTHSITTRKQQSIVTLHLASPDLLGDIDGNKVVNIVDVAKYKLLFRYQKGDINRDGSVNSVDSSLVMMYYAKASTMKDDETIYDVIQQVFSEYKHLNITVDDVLRADMNNNGLVDAVDASIILSTYAGLSTGHTADLYPKEVKVTDRNWIAGLVSVSGKRPDMLTANQADYILRTLKNSKYKLY